MAAEKTILRLIASERVITGWENGNPIGEPEAVLRLIGAEVAALRLIAEANPDTQSKVVSLVNRYQALAERFKAKAH